MSSILAAWREQAIEAGKQRDQWQMGVEIQETDNGGRNNTQTGWHRELSEAEWLDSTAQRILDAGCEIEESRMTPQFFLNSYLYDFQ